MEKRGLWIFAGIFLFAAVAVLAVFFRGSGKSPDELPPQSKIDKHQDEAHDSSANEAKVRERLTGPQRAERFFPSNTVVYFSAEHVETTWDKFKESALYKLYNNKDIREFLNILGSVDDLFKDMEEKVGLRWEDIRTIFKSQIGIGLIMPEKIQKDSKLRLCAAGYFGDHISELRSALQKWTARVRSTGKKKVTEYRSSTPKMSITAVYEPGEFETGLRFAIVDNQFFLMGEGAGTLERMVAVYRGFNKAKGQSGSLTDDPELISVLSKLDAEPDTIIFVRFGELWKHYQREDLGAMRFYSEFGFFDMRSIGLSSRFIDGGIRGVTYIHAPGKRRGIPLLMEQPPTSRRTLSIVPAKSLFVLSVNCNPAKTWHEFMRGMRDGGDATYATLSKKIRAIEKTSNINWDTDVLGLLTGELSGAVSIVQRGTIPFPEFMFFAEVKDAKKAESILTKIFKPLPPDKKLVSERGKRQFAITQLKKEQVRAVSDGKSYTVYYRAIPKEVMFPDIAFVVKDGIAVIGRYAAVKSFLQMTQKDFLPMNKDYQRVISPVEVKGASAYGYLNLISGVDTFYDVIMSLLKKSARFTKGVTFINPDKIPPREAFTRHLSGVGGSFTAVDDDGFCVRTYSSVGEQFLAAMIIPAYLKYQDLKKQGEVEEPLKNTYCYLNKWVDDNAKRMGVLPEKLDLLLPEYMNEIPAGVGYFPLHNVNGEIDPLTGGYIHRKDIPLLYSTSKTAKGRAVIFLDGRVHYIKEGRFVQLKAKEDAAVETRRKRWAVEIPLMRVAAAIQSFAVNNADVEGDAPKTLKELVPEYLKTIPEKIGYLPGRNIYDDPDKIVVYSEVVIPGVGRPVIKANKKLQYVDEDAFKRLLEE